jgi:hypothetical protein
VCREPLNERGSGAFEGISDLQQILRMGLYRTDRGYASSVAYDVFLYFTVNLALVNYEILN